MFWLLALVLGSQGWAANFGGQTTFKSFPIEGQLHIECREGGNYDHRYVWCQDNVLTPYEYAYFHGEAGTGADHVNLVCDRADGKKVLKSSGYDSTKGQSTDDFNLWIETVFQTALLSEGKNLVHYELKAQDKSVQTGSVEITVEQAELRSCPSDHILTWSMDDCRFPGQMCARYFRRHNYCQP